MKKFKNIFIILVVLVVLLLAFEKPILQNYYTFGTPEMEIDYGDDLLLYTTDIKTANKSKYMQYEVFSDVLHIKLPNSTKIKTFNLQSTKTHTENLKTCFACGENYCLLFSMLPNHFPVTERTHKFDQLIVLDKNGNEIDSFTFAPAEWILDCSNGVVLLYNSKETCFYHKLLRDPDSNIIERTDIEDCGKFDKIVFSKGELKCGAKFYYGNNAIHEQFVAAAHLKADLIY